MSVIKDSGANKTFNFLNSGMFGIIVGIFLIFIFFVLNQEGDIIQVLTNNTFTIVSLILGLGFGAYYFYIYQKWLKNTKNYVETALNPIVNKYGGGYEFNKSLSFKAEFTSYFGTSQPGYDFEIKGVKIFINTHYLSALTILPIQSSFYKGKTPDIEVLIKKKLPIELNNKMKELGYNNNPEEYNWSTAKAPKLIKEIAGMENTTVYLKKILPNKEQPNTLTNEINKIIQTITPYLE
ncbi:hypothetical protein COX58_03245 [archaeon CG_4_10_14_0_2_um_filter_Archaea_38_6]|nr:MAG: hypothetical protein COS83_03130 [archaeon CG07_land_8_20_14_0_80_38_8]PIU89385.1 MAG: hypothetical protein COS64_00750 [archaeon CG06_land_8_20_14_3_00_37_11]PJA21861.1 MAG: hypothetical protein COX58_03245 [archaeon CG_4_10_14_0_2_um_filter_Archaea_38_6]